MVLRDIRCPNCDRLQFKMMGTVTWLERRCRCKSTFVVQGMEVLPVSAAASPSATFAGVSYRGFSIAVK